MREQLIEQLKEDITLLEDKYLNPKEVDILLRRWRHRYNDRELFQRLRRVKKRAIFTSKERQSCQSSQALEL